MSESNKSGVWFIREGAAGAERYLKVEIFDDPDGCLARHASGVASVQATGVTMQGALAALGTALGWVDWVIDGRERAASPEAPPSVDDRTATETTVLAAMRAAIESRDAEMLRAAADAYRALRGA